MSERRGRHFRKFYAFARFFRRDVIMAMIYCYLSVTSLPRRRNSLVLHCASLLRTIFASLARAHEHVSVQNVRDFPQTELDSEINAPFLLNELGDPQIFFQVFTTNSPIKNIFEEEKKFDSRTLLFWENSSLLGAFWPRQGLQANHGSVQKSAIFPQPSNQKQLK